MNRSECIEACLKCATDCDHCLAQMAGKGSDNACPRCCAECAAVCRLCAQLEAMGSDFAARACALCAEVCDWCASPVRASTTTSTANGVPRAAAAVPRPAGPWHRDSRRPVSPRPRPMKHTYTVEGMHCASCTAKVEEALLRDEHVTAARVRLDPPEAEVTMRDHVATHRLDGLVKEAGDYHISDAMPRHAPAPASDAASAGKGDAGGESLYPIFLIVGYLLGVTVLIAASTGRWEVMPMMRHFMAGFFLVFSFFKLLDLRGFMDTYRGYDLLARRFKVYAAAYPFIELLLGVAYLINLHGR